MLKSYRNLASMVAAAIIAVVAMAPNRAPAEDKPVVVFAAASLKNALDDFNAAYTKSGGARVTASYAASSTLMQQIEQGAPADIFVSADLKWMDYGAQKRLIKNDSRVDLLGNRLVLIAPKASVIGNVAIGPGFDLAGLATGGHIATGDVRAVPVGLYAKEALENLGIWAAVQPKLAMADNVRAALLLVSRGEAPLGIVYETDAKIDPGVKIIGVFPENSHSPIVYPAALTATAAPAAVRYIAALRAPSSKAVFEKYGFTFLIKAAP